MTHMVSDPLNAVQTTGARGQGGAGTPAAFLVSRLIRTRLRPDGR
jgi:hypothetical protein